MKLKRNLPEFHISFGIKSWKMSCSYFTFFQWTSISVIKFEKKMSVLQFGFLTQHDDTFFLLFSLPPSILNCFANCLNFLPDFFFFFNPLDQVCYSEYSASWFPMQNSAFFLAASQIMKKRPRVLLCNKRKTTVYSNKYFVFTQLIFMPI